MTSALISAVCVAPVLHKLYVRICTNADCMHTHFGYGYMCSAVCAEVVLDMCCFITCGGMCRVQRHAMFAVQF